jgi:hypothetical protein
MDCRPSPELIREGVNHSQQGPFAPWSLLHFLATSDPSDSLSSWSAFPVFPVIRSTVLRRFLARTRRVSPVAQRVLATMPSLTTPPE